MLCLSINYRKADALVRERFAFDKEKRSKLRHALGSSVVLCTCNRTELFFSDSDPDRAAALLSKLSGVEDTAELLYSYEGNGAVRHLFRVASGLDSMIIGEDEILRQVKEAYSEAAEDGTTSTELNTVFQAAVTAAKRVKTETALSKTPASAATVAANEAAGSGEAVNILMIGSSGKIGSSTLKNLLCHPNVHITRTSRSHSGIALDRKNVRTVAYDDRYKYADEADCIISSTSSPHFTLTAKRLREALHTRKPRLLIDLAVPHDIERGVSELDGVRLIDIDDIGAAAQQGCELKMSAAEQAESIIEEELDELLKKLTFSRFLPGLAEAKRAAGKLTFEKLLYKLRDGLNSEQFSAVLDIIGKLEE